MADDMCSRTTTQLFWIKGGLLNMDMNYILNIINNRLTETNPFFNSDRPAKLISERRLYPYDWLVQLFEKANITVVYADGIPMLQLLQNFGELSLDMCILHTDGRSGTNFLIYTENKVKQIRTIAFNVGIMFVSANKDNNINPNLLPARTWLITPSTTPDEIAAYISESRYALSNNSFFSRNRNRFYATPILEKKADMQLENGTFPNFNIKHPAMLLPIAKIATRNSTPVFVEISPQEALVYYDYIGSGNDIYANISNIFRTLRMDVDWVKSHTGAQMFLHLDHCDDAEIIKRALECGFDSIMADGSNQTLNSNIRFVQAIKKMATFYNVPVEGEIGAIDLHGFRKKSTTICSEMDVFVEATNADYVGVNVRQFHGCDYGFSRARKAYLQYIENNQKKDHIIHNLLQSCFNTDKVLAEKGYSKNSTERITIKILIDKIVSAEEDSIFLILSNITSSASISGKLWINEIKKEWHFKQREVAEENQRLLNDVIGFGIKDDMVNEKNLDFYLLASIAESLKNTNTRIVLHGGSSIKKDDLQYLPKYGVSRINFGSNPYKLLINSVKNEAVGKHNYQDDPLNYNPLESSYFINKYASDWETWLDEPPSFLSDYEYELETQFFKPIINKFGV